VKPQLKEVYVSGDFPIILHIDSKRLPIQLDEVRKLIVENNPIAFSGQRTPVYELSNGLYLRAKGFAYRPAIYKEIREHILDAYEPMTVNGANELGLQMAKIKRPFPKRFKESSAHFYRLVPQPDGTHRRRLTAPRPYAAMSLDRAIREYESHVWAREQRLPVDLPIGYAEFPELGFEHKGEKIRCGGFLALIPTPYDLRSLEILNHLPHNTNLQTMYQIYSKYTDALLLHFLFSMGSFLSVFHNSRRTITYSHIMNVKIGIVNENMTPCFKTEDGTPLVSFCDLDAVEYHANRSKRVFLANMMQDITGLLYLPKVFLNTTETPESMAPKWLDDDQKWMADLTCRVRDQSKLKPPTNLPGLYALAGYFGTNPANTALTSMDAISFEKQRINGKIQDLRDDPLIYLLRKRHKMDLRGVSDVVKYLADMINIG